MRTRSKSAAARGQIAGPDLPEGPQLRVLSLIAKQYTFPDDHEYALHPYKTSFCWLTSLLRVSQSWRSHLSNDANFIRRSRLEALRRISLWHDYVYIMKGSIPRSKKQKRLPSSVMLPFQHGPAVECSIQKQLTAAENSGLPSDCLMIRIEACKVCPTVLLPLLRDQVLLDAEYTTPFVIKIVKQHACGTCSSPYLEAPGAKQQQQQQDNQHAATEPWQELLPPAQQLVTAAEGAGAAGAAAGAIGAAAGGAATAGAVEAGPEVEAAGGTVAAAVAAATPGALHISSNSSCRLDALASAYHALQQAPQVYMGTAGSKELAAVRALVLERGEGGQALYFIPTWKGFRRRQDQQQ